MTLPLSGVIKLSDIRAEYGGPSPARLKDYYLNGPHVHQNPNGTIPATGQIKLKDFYGGIGGYAMTFVVNPMYTLNITSFPAADNYHAIIFGYDGRIFSEGYAPSDQFLNYRNQIGTWLSQGNAAGKYIRVTISSNLSGVPMQGVTWYGISWTGENNAWQTVPNNNGGGLDTTGFGISFSSGDDYIPNATVDFLVEFSDSPSGPATASTIVRFNLNQTVVQSIAPNIANFEVHRTGANIAELSLQFFDNMLIKDQLDPGIYWSSVIYGRLTILASSTFYPPYVGYNGDVDSLQFTGGPQSSGQANPPLPATSGWVHMALGYTLDIFVQTATGEEGATVPTTQVKFRIDFASAPGDQYIERSQDFTIDIYGAV